MKHTKILSGFYAASLCASLVACEPSNQIVGGQRTGDSEIVDDEEDASGGDPAETGETGETEPEEPVENPIDECSIEPADSQLILEARRVLCYLESVYGQRLLSAGYSTDGFEAVTTCAGVTPAIAAEDLSGWNPPKYGESYVSVMEAELQFLVDHHARGGIVQLQWHWPNPLTGGSDFGDTQIPLTDPQWDAIVTPGTPEYEIMIDDLDYHADFIRRFLTDNNIPVLWRPLHEIDGGWFWWTCRSDGTKTAELWRIVYDRLVNHHGLHNLIWVYSTGIETPGGDTPDTAYRHDTYPGAEYVDIVGIDLYSWDLETGEHEFWDWTATYRAMFDMMATVAPGKMIALTECQATPDPAKSFGSDPAFAPWLWALPWWGTSEGNDCARVNTTHNDPNVVNLDDLPSFE